MVQRYFNACCHSYYIYASYVKDKRTYKLFLVGFLIMLLPYIRHQAVAISALFVILPVMGYYFKVLSKAEYLKSIKIITGVFLIFNILFIFYVILIGSGKTLFLSMFTVIGMAQPTVEANNAKSLFNLFYTAFTAMFNYTSFGTDYYGTYSAFFYYWIVVLIPAFYFIAKSFILLSDKSPISQQQYIRFIVSMVVLVSVVFNYPYNEEFRQRAHFSIGIWLVIDILILSFYSNKSKILSVLAILSICFFLNIGRITSYCTTTISNWNELIVNSRGLVLMPKGNAFAGMLLSKEKSDEINSIINALRFYEKRNPGVPTVFDGNVFVAGMYSYVYLSAENPKLQHNFPYAMGKNRESYIPDISDRFKEYIKLNKPIIVSLNSEIIPLNYALLATSKSYGLDLIGYRNDGYDYSFDSRILCSECDKTFDSVTLRPDGVLFGPYIGLEPGIYNVEYRGIDLLGGGIDAVAKDGQESLSINIIEYTDTYIKYSFELQEFKDKVEFRFFNKSNHEVTITKWQFRLIED